MSAITPQTDVYLLKVPLEIDNDNQLTFTNAASQHNYFDGLPKIALDNFTYQRKDGTIRVPYNIDDIITYNYVMYRNEGFSNKWFYAYITGMEFLNPSTTLVSIKTDTFQTWQFDLTYKPTFVEREHVNDDTVGANTVPESVELGEYEVVDLRNSPLYETSSPSTDFCVCFQVTKYPNNISSVVGENNTVGGVFTSLHLIATANYGAARNLITVYNETSELTADAIVNVYLIPDCCVDINRTTGMVASTNTPPSNFHSASVGGGVSVYPVKDSFTSSEYKIQEPSVLAENYSPVNKKLLTYPYSYLYLSNKAGTDIVYHWEDFPLETLDGITGRTASYKKAMVPTTSVSAKLYFTKYKGYSETADYGTRMYNYGINYAKVPVCGWTTDYYTNWLTQNGVNIGLNAASSIGGAILGTAMGVATGGMAGIGMFAAGMLGLSNNINKTIGETHKASTTPPQAHGDANSSDVMFAYTRNSISFYEMSIRPEYARIIDGYFSMFGYKVNKVKLPNITGRRNWNYVKTMGCYIDADIPQDDLQEIKSLFDKGITLWHNPATFADYTQNNDII